MNFYVLYNIYHKNTCKKLNQNRPQYLQSRNSQLAFHLPPPTPSAPATCLCHWDYKTQLSPSSVLFSEVLERRLSPVQYK